VVREAEWKVLRIDGSASSLNLSLSLSRHLTYAVVACPLTASSHQVHAARVSGLTLRKIIWLEQGWANYGLQAV